MAKRAALVDLSKLPQNQAVHREAALKAVLCVLSELSDEDKIRILRTCATFYALDLQSC